MIGVVGVTVMGGSVAGAIVPGMVGLMLTAIVYGRGRAAVI
jgi:hypothetical protein